VRLDRVNPVAIRAHRGQSVATRQRLPVNALHKGAVDVRMALAAGGRNRELVDRRLGVVRSQYLVRAVAIRAHCGLLRSLLCRPPMHAFLVRVEGLRAFAVRLHQKLLTMATAAGVRDVVVIHRRLGIARGHDLVNPAVTIFAACGRRAALGELCVHAARVSVVRIRVALRAGHPLRRCLMNQALYVLVAIHAREH